MLRNSPDCFRWKVVELQFHLTFSVLTHLPTCMSARVPMIPPVVNSHGFSCSAVTDEPGRGQIKIWFFLQKALFFMQLVCLMKPRNDSSLLSFRSLKYFSHPKSRLNSEFLAFFQRLVCLTALFDDSTGCRIQTHKSSVPRTNLASQTSKGICFICLYIFERVFDKGSTGSESSCLHVPKSVSYTPPPGQGRAKLAPAS